MSNQPASRIAAGAAMGGALLLFVGTYLHPMDADPNVPLAAFTEYAADRHWVATHLMQLFGVALMVGALVLLSRSLAGGPASAAATVGMVAAIASLSVAGALQAVDGVALKSMVNAWAAASGPDKAALFHAAFAVRQIEIELASITAMFLGMTATIYGIALLIDPRFPKWLGSGALAGGVPTAVGGVAVAYTGVSELAMDINMPSNSVLLLWMLALGVHLWRHRGL